MKAHLLFSAGAVGLVYILAGSLPLAAMPPAEKKILGSEELKESEAKISLNTTVENHVKAPETSELKFVEGLQVDNTVSTTNQLANLPQETANLNLPETAALTAENPGENSLNLAEKPANPAPAVTEQVSVAPTQNSQTPAEVTEKTSVIPAPNPAPVIAQTETSTSEKLAEIENSASLEPAATNSQTSESSELQQVTSVSQLSDVRPTDWAFQALQSLVERYGCIAGYPDGTFRGNRAMTRYEFAAGLNACLDKVTELIKSGTTNLATKEDLAALQRLQEEFAAELATVRGRVDALEARTSELEANQFSTTTKLSGEAIFSVADTTKNNRRETETALNYRLRLNLLTSFTGKDTLITGLQAYNIRSFGPNLGLSTGAFSGLSDSQAKLSFEPQFPGINPQTLSSIDANAVELYKLLYVFPVSNSITLFAGPKAETSDAFQAITPFAGEGQEAVSRFAAYNPVVRVSGGTSGSGLASAGGFIWNISKKVNLTALYGSVNAALPNDLGFPATPLGAGAFDGSTVAAAQLTIKPTSSIDIGLNYAHSRHKLNILATGLSDADLGSILGRDREPVSGGVRINSFGGTATWRLSPKLAVSTYGGWIIADAERSNASTTFNSWMVGLHFRDLFAQGNNAGILFGQPLDRDSVSGGARFQQNKATPYHLEAYYRFKVNDNISITPGAFVLFNPEGTKDNDTVGVGVLRTTFTF
ncbi:cyanobacterial porin [Oscillatoria nigro-viridis PCC 7112]|uniref:Cyanobacterial porin n=1 Tax=Phormidium nigroviride PCC 7112 TaxID=179408 RepID=K9VPM4_9CYAN|nr:iron uptake porin [Oscillatoria nigro-viridis]AFZ09452.1 cyanobacterial porin [Oscillatoria nigro-viridis PCC 7112]